MALTLFTLNDVAFAKNNDDESSSGSDTSGSHYGGSSTEESTDSSSGSSSSSHYGGSDDNACSDSYYNCAQYVNNGYCPTYFCSTCSYANYCDASCGYCSTSDPVPSPTPHPIPSPTVAADTHNNDDYDYSDQCFSSACGCPNSWRGTQTTCTIDNALETSSTCQKRQSKCESKCGGVWCDGSESVPVPPTPQPNPAPVPHPTSHPIPSPTAHPIPSPTAHPIPRPTAHPIPSPTAHPIPRPTAHPIPSPTAHPIPRPTSHPVPGPTLHPIPSPTAHPIPYPTAHPIGSPTPSPIVAHDGGRTCFSADDRLTLENGEKIPFAKLKIGDSVLSAKRDGKISYSKVVFLPHGENFTPTTFIKISTEQNKEIKLTPGHLLQLCSGKLLAAHLLTTINDINENDINDDSHCLRTIHGNEKIISKEEIESNGVYTAVVENEFLVVNGIIASPFAASAALAHAYFNITDMEDWCSSHNWMVYENLHHQALIDVMNAHDTLITPSQDCMSLLTNMFKKFKDEPIGWGVNGWGYRGWANPSTLHNIQSSNKEEEKKVETHTHLRHKPQEKPISKSEESIKNVPIPGIISGWE